MPDDMVLLKEVKDQAEADVIISMLDAYGIHAAKSDRLTRRGWHVIRVNEADLGNARALVARAEEPDEEPDRNEPPSFASLTMRTGVAAMIAVLIILLTTTYAGSFVSAEERILSRFGLLHTSLLMCAGAIIGSALARWLCDKYIGIYSRKAVMVALVAYYAAGPIWLAFRYVGDDAEATLLQIAPGLCIVIASLVFWPAHIHRAASGVSS